MATPAGGRRARHGAPHLTGAIIASRFRSSQKSMNSPRTAAIMAGELGRDEGWQKSQVEAFSEIAEGYLYRPGK